MKIEGLNKLTKTFDEAQKALSGIDGEIGTVSFQPNDPASIETAIRHVDDMIDQRLGAYASNPIIAPLIDAMKERYREGIIEEAATARLEKTLDADRYFSSDQ